MNSHRTEPERLLFEVLNTAERGDASEDEIRLRVVNLIESLLDQRTARLETRTQTGYIDILYGNVIIEAKTRADRLGVAPTWARRDQETRRLYAASQLQDYVNERYAGVTSESTHFIGYTTSGNTWHRWEVNIGGEVPTLMWTKHLNQATFGETTAHDSGLTTAIDDLFNDLVSHLGGRPSPPDDLQQILAGLPELAYQRAKDLVGDPEFETKRSVWSDLMRGAFILRPEQHEQDLRLFATHSVLVDIARRVADNVANLGQNLNEQDESEFFTWLRSEPLRETQDSDDSSGSAISDTINREINRYNWRLAGADILKNVYHEFIPRDVRHDFGEYYTPDWLAEAMCERVLDDNWCAVAVNRALQEGDDLTGIGVLEPSCGSGTFLRAAARRIIPFAQEVTQDRVEQSNIVCRLIHGIDIHPVAVELAKATLLAALPEVPTGQQAALNVHISDTLRWMQDTQMRLIGHDAILINVRNIGQLEQVDLLIPNDVVVHPRFNSIVDEVGDFADNLPVLEARLNHYGFNQQTVDATLDLATSLLRLRQENRNHVWAWFIKNVAVAHRLHRRKFDRVIGNPPWITTKDINQGSPERATKFVQESQRLGIWAGGSTFATQNNLAALFSATVARDYTSDRELWRVGFVLPWSALRSKTWAKFRTGKWNDNATGANDEWTIDLSETPWDLRDINDRPFPQSDACVIFGRGNRDGNKDFGLPSRHQLWSINGINFDSMWIDIRNRIERTDTNEHGFEKSSYLDAVHNGANVTPNVLLRIEHGSIAPGGKGMARFRTQRSARRNWKDIPQIDSTVESECLRRLIVSSDIAPFRIVRETFAVIPPNQAILQTDEFAKVVANLPRFSSYWHKSDSVWRERRSRNTPETLMAQIDHLGKLAKQVDTATAFRVAYPKSGSILCAVTVDAEMIVENNCYYVEVSSQEEADYLASILSADALQRSFTDVKNTDRHFDKLPLERVPIPTYDPNNGVHATLADLGNRAKIVAASVQLSGGTSKMRQTIRDTLRQDGVMAEIDRCTRELLPQHAEDC